MSVFNLRAYDDHEQIVFCSDTKSGLKAIIAIHDTTLGPAVGGCRMWEYNTDEGALVDALRLSRGMTYKNAMAGLPFGGGKSVIIGNSKTMKSEELFRAFGRFVESISGRYVTAEDVGTSPADIAIVHKETKHVLGLEGKSGDPSPYTAYGCYLGIKAAVKHKLGRDNLDGVSISLQGAGHVGYYLAKHLASEGAKLFVTDINKEAVEKVVADCGATAVDINAIYGLDVDVYAPCALGATVNDETLKMLKAKIIAGAANNVLAEDRHGYELTRRGVLYAPDYVINAGGIINVSFEENYSSEASKRKVEEIYNTLSEIFATAVKDGRPTHVIADELARQRIANAKK
ncbi:MAG: Glu/Leu/Phe/Val dehydrogenase [Gammaproteobacteria bacterium]|nr:Glu/Leu/Phe/Val dehydrogenase [Gammaproteobacteria bacterium]